MTYQLTKKVIKQIELLDKKDRKKIDRAFQTIKEANKFLDIPNIEKIKATDNVYRIKVTPYRILIVKIYEGVIIREILKRNERTYK